MAVIFLVVQFTIPRLLLCAILDLSRCRQFFKLIEKIMAHFIAPNIPDNPTGWGPCAEPDAFKDMPFQPFSKGDRLGKVSHLESCRPDRLTDNYDNDPQDPSHLRFSHHYDRFGSAPDTAGSGTVRAATHTYINTYINTCRLRIILCLLSMILSDKPRQGMLQRY